MPKANTCPDCGPKSTGHFFRKTSIFFEWLFLPVLRPFEFLGEKFVSVFGLKNHDLLVNLLLIIRILKEAKIDEEDNLRMRLAAEEAERRGIVMRKLKFFSRSTVLCVAYFKERRLIFEQLPRPQGYYESLKWLDNKAVIREKFLKLGMPVAAGGRAFTLKKALRIFKTIGAPVIIKPHIGSRSAHTTIHINTVTELISAFRKAKQLSPWVVVEKELSGFVHRITFIGGKLFACLRREQPHVVGDGVSSIRELIFKENKNPKRDNTYFYQLPMDEKAEEEIRYHGFTWSSIPQDGQVVLLNQKAVGYLGSGLTDLTDVIHPANVEMFEKIDKLLATPLHGIDFMTTDISKPWQTIENCGVIECNSLPFLEMHHNPLVGQPRDAIGALWDIAFLK
ncbi:MAG: hypothetical protein A3J48_00210 [Candidatus Doudnabacteria bacterium RIFCSPHIGHO2_02_FULL_46_11]|uniref:ATP-grasp domain-containing protein n=1 Tax=Candidatus Doudnabacteria bacterium RIFCSPHIGHO2_02_FULL_46_11 TaxID=1817832 RepID=A0A1F5P6K3_9BACT|nr:MAG: hypothetical protein A3J48_00210 [Candidatus Doudnabacteria bacterium RIFCSPHIGHO2_02_FULL_46_11]